jgi:hypothetical protein
MSRKKPHIHYIYKTTCDVTKRYYIGMHSTTNLEDGYLGSGKRLRYSIRKYGKENHTKEILEFLPTREELIIRELKIVDKILISDKLCMNLKEGGSGGFTKKDWEKGQIASSILMKERWKDPEYRDKMIRVRQEGVKKLHREGKVKYDTFKGKKHRPESIEKMKESKKNQGKGVNNSQYGTQWITNETENKKIKKSELIPQGWRLGRKINNGGIV